VPVGKTGFVVAIDGPAGAGKSTLARGLAEAAGLPFINTGLMYRSVAHRALQQGVEPDDAPALASIARSLRFTLGDGELPHLQVDGREPDPSLSSEEVEAVVSEVSRHTEVQAVLRARQRDLGEAGCVMEGRDIGTVVFPDADVKIFVSASLGVRAGRREDERGGSEQAAESVAARDALDARTNPLMAAPDAQVLETTSLSKEEVFAKALDLVRQAERTSQR